TTSGTLTVKIKTKNSVVGCGIVEDIMTITILPNPTASVSAISPICEGEASTITFTATPNTTVTYTIGGGANQTIAIGTAGTATLTTSALTANTTIQLINVQYSTEAICIQPLTGSATITVNPLAVV